MSPEELFINGELLRLRREARGWAVGDMASRACMSVKQIRQIEDGGMSSFYSVAVKATAAKKVGGLLGLSPEEVFAQNSPPVTVEDSVDTAHSAQTQVTDDAVVEVEPSPLVQESVNSDHEHATDVVVGTDSAEDGSKSKIGLIAVLFAAALAVAAYLQPQEEPVVESAPPIQVLPVDATDPASAASAAEAPASVADAVASAPFVAPASAQKPVVPVASSPRVATSAASAPVTRLVGVVPVASPAASVASKAP